jgi:tetratricopeptide (TPR) repeat protein
LAAAAAFLERAAALTSRSPLGAHRALAAARLKYQAGALDDALALLATAETGGLDDLGRARALRLRAQIAFASSRGSDAPPLLLRAARELEALDSGLSRATYLEALGAARFVAPLSRGADPVEVSEAVLAGPAPTQPARPPDLLLQGWAIRCVRGDAAGAPILKNALAAFRQAALPPDEARWIPQACQAAADVWDDETWRALAERELERVRAAGALTALPWAITVLSWILVISGEVAAAASLLGECRAATDAAEIPRHPYVELWVVALRGREAELSRLVRKTRREGMARGEGFALAVIAQATAVTYNALGRYGEALAAVRESLDVEPFTEMGSPRISAELIEAADRCGERRLAERGLERLSESARAAGTDWALGVEGRSRALLADGEAADGLYREAIERLRRTRVRLQLARTHLLYGEWLRREGRRGDARDQLRTALELFTSMGTDAFAARRARAAGNG